MKRIASFMLMSLPFLASAQGWTDTGNNYTTGSVLINGGFQSSANYGLTLVPTGDAIIRRSTAGNLMLSSGGTNSEIRLNYSYGGGSGGLLLFDGGNTNNAHFKVNSSGYLSISASGSRVGIGTNSPNHLFQIHSSDNPTLAIGTLGMHTNKKSTLAFYAADGGYGNGFFVQYTKDISNDRLGFVDGGGLERLTIKNGGNVGIGTTNPDQKLTVKGKIHSEEVIVDLNVPGPDYVFEKDYNLLSLSEIEKYINENKHLPEVPSAKEMEADGVKLMEMNMLLLKKVEELTLHLIEIQKVNIEQQKQIEELQTRKK